MLNDATNKFDVLRDRLLSERDTLQRRLQSHLNGMSRVEHAHEVLLQDADDDTQRNSDRAVDLAVTDHDAQALQDIDLALQKLDKDSYGICEECGCAIPEARLAHMPAARRCVACENLREKSHGTVRSPTF